MPIINRDYVGAYQQGRQTVDDERSRMARNALAQQEIQQQNRLSGLMQDPNTSPEQFVRAGRSDIGNSLLGLDANKRGLAEDDAKKNFVAIQYALQSGNPKEFIRQNLPELAAKNPTFDRDTPEQIAASLQQGLAHYGSIIGVGPAKAPTKWVSKPGPRGSVIQENPDTGEQKQVVGPDNSQPSPGNSGQNNYRMFQMADKLRDEFNAQSKDFINVGDSYNTVRAAASDPTAAGDLSLIFAYMKMLDPNSVVREQEFANAQNAAGVPDRVRNQWNKVLNGERLNPDQRKDFMSQAEKVYRVRQTRNKSVVDRYTNLAKRNGLDPNDVIGDFNISEPAAAPGAPGVAPAAPAAAPVQIKSDEEYAKLPSGAQYVAPDGSVRRKK